MPDEVMQAFLEQVIQSLDDMMGALSVILEQYQVRNSEQKFEDYYKNREIL